MVVRIDDPEYGGSRADNISAVSFEHDSAPGSQGTRAIRSRDARLESAYRVAEARRRLLAIELRTEITSFHIALPPGTP